MSTLPIIPGRGIVSATSTQLRLNFLKEKNIDVRLLSETTLDISQIQNNIESYIGAIEIPVGIVGPLLYQKKENAELVYCAAGTLEGALVASMNRGVKAMSLSGGFSAQVRWQKMCRVPLFIFENIQEATLFTAYIPTIFHEIKKETKKYSNHASLQQIHCIQDNVNVHLKFYYTTGDASGQNMTTICTWHAMLFIVEAFKINKGITPLDFIIEGNGSSDKKVSSTNIRDGRGIHVVAECFLSEKIIKEVLRTSSDKMMQCYNASKKITQEEGMVGYNINVANAIASIFVSTGQDLACIHESAVGILNLENKPNGLLLQLTLPNLVIGTVGGGTHLEKQSEALEIMGCLGTGKVERFAELIAGFALGLEISTFAAIVSGEFAKAHEKLGRNKPVKWLLKSELREEYIYNSLNDKFKNTQLERIISIDESLIDNGIITSVASKISKKLMGFVPFQFDYRKNGILFSDKILLKSKALDQEIIKGLHVIAASIDPKLSDLIYAHKDSLEYRNCHLKELDIYSFLHDENFIFTPTYYGKLVNEQREIYFFLQELLDYDQLSIVNSENKPELWSNETITSVLEVMSIFHNNAKTKNISSIQQFSASESLPLYEKLLSIILNERVDSSTGLKIRALIEDMGNWESEVMAINIPKVVIHNDCNPRNIAIRKNGKPCIYDWELAVIDFPSRDIVEFLSFVLTPNFTKETLLVYLNHYAAFTPEYDLKEWMKAFKYSLKTYIATRLSFYEVSGILINYDFSTRVLTVALQMLDYLNEDE